MNGSSFSATGMAVWHISWIPTGYRRSRAYIKRLRGEQDDLVELRQVGEEVIDARSLGGSPPLDSLFISSCSDEHESKEATYIP